MVPSPIYDIFIGMLLFWPIVVGVVALSFIGILVFAIFVGSTISIILLLAYTIYTVLKEYGWFEWANEQFQNWTRDTRAHIRKSFILETAKANVKEKGPCLYIAFPHGLYAISWFIHFCLDISEWPSEIQRPRLAIHSSFFRVPFVRELMIYHGCIEATEESILKTLEKGESVAIVLGGIEELQLNSTDITKIILNKRNGYARIASRRGVPIVPLFTVGENQLFPVIKSPLWNEIQTFLYKSFHLATPLPTLESFRTWFSITRKPLDPPLVTHFLTPIQTAQKSIQRIKQEVEKSLLEFKALKKVSFEIVG